MKSFRTAMGLSLLLGWCWPASAAVVTTSKYKPNEVIVKYKEGIRRDRVLMEAIYSAADTVKVKRFGGNFRQFEQLILDKKTDVKQAIAELEKNPAVEYAQPNYILKALPVKIAARKKDIPCIPGLELPGCTPMPCLLPNFPPGCDDGGGGGGGGGGGEEPEPTKPGTRPEVGQKPADVVPPIADPDVQKAYGMSTIGATKIWDKHRGSQDMIVAVIDTGVDYTHEDIAYNMWRNPKADKGDIVGWDFVHNDNLPYDDNEHGTHCAGVIGAVGGNGKGVSGVNQRVSIMALKFLSGKGSGDTAGAIKAIDYAIAHGAKVLSNSWGGGGEEDNKGLRDAIKRAEAKDVLFVAAAGNGDQFGRGQNNDTTPTFPAGFDEPNLIAVAATDSSDKIASFSNYGAKTVHLAAPGVGIYSSIPGNKYESMSGTSMACPHVAGAAALVWSENPKMTYREVKAKLMNSVDKIPAMSGKAITEGRLNVEKALN